MIKLSNVLLFKNNIMHVMTIKGVSSFNPSFEDLFLFCVFCLLELGGTEMNEMSVSK